MNVWAHNHTFTKNTEVHVRKNARALALTCAHTRTDKQTVRQTQTHTLRKNTPSQMYTLKQ